MIRTCVDPEITNASSLFLVFGHLFECNIVSLESGRLTSVNRLSMGLGIRMTIHDRSGVLGFKFLEET
eukprot:scaffold396202_cov76-Attheya_sp.AAC.1